MGFEHRTERHRRKRRSDSTHGGVEVVERFFLDLGCDLGTEAAEPDRFVGNEGAVSFPN